MRKRGWRLVAGPAENILHGGSGAPGKLRCDDRNEALHLRTGDEFVSSER